MSMKKKKVLIIGGGAAGMAAGIAAAGEGAEVTILEHGQVPGKKLLATGNGKCNLTNLNRRPDAYRGTDPEFVQPVLAQCPVPETIRFFSDLGLYTKNRNGYLYPNSEQAAGVRELLLKELEHRKVKIKTNEEITSILPGWQVSTKTWNYEGDAVIVCTGSCASSIEGADSSGYGLLQSLGHTLVKPLPALVPLVCRNTGFSKWAGVRIDGTVTLCLDQTPCKTEAGELQLTDYGVSGIPVFQLSRYAVRALEENCPVTLHLDFMPMFQEQELEAFFESRRRAFPYKNNRELLTTVFPEKLIPVLLKGDLIRNCKSYDLTVTGSRPFAYAQTVSGGVSTGEVFPQNLESRLHRGLYFAGEVLDVDGACGGYNLQWAWSSGIIAGRNAAKETI